MRAFLALGGAVTALGFVLLVWSVRQQVAVSDCHVRCIGPNPWPVTALGILLMLGGAGFAAWTAVSARADRELRMGEEPPAPPEPPARESDDD